MEYAITGKGEALRPSLEALMAWGEEHVLGDKGGKRDPAPAGSSPD